MVNHYNNMIPTRSHLLTHIIQLTAKNTKFHWTADHQTAFDQVKQSIARRIALAYPDFNQPFLIYTDASKYQLGSVIMQGDQVIAFYSRKLTDP